MVHLTYVTRHNDRWDLIADRHYGSVRLQTEIIAANRDLFIKRPMEPLPAVLPEGITLRIPILAEAADESALPPWKRGRGLP